MFSLYITYFKDTKRGRWISRPRSSLNLLPFLARDIVLHRAVSESRHRLSFDGKFRRRNRQRGRNVQNIIFERPFEFMDAVYQPASGDLHLPENPRVLDRLDGDIDLAGNRRKLRSPPVTPPLADERLGIDGLSTHARCQNEQQNNVDKKLHLGFSSRSVLVLELCSSRVNRLSIVSAFSTTSIMVT